MAKHLLNPFSGAAGTPAAGAQLPAQPLTAPAAAANPTTLTPGAGATDTLPGAAAPAAGVTASQPAAAQGAAGPADTADGTGAVRPAVSTCEAVRKRQSGRQQLRKSVISALQVEQRVMSSALPPHVLALELWDWYWRRMELSSPCVSSLQSGSDPRAMYLQLDLLDLQGLLCRRTRSSSAAALRARAPPAGWAPPAAMACGRAPRGSAQMVRIFLPCLNETT